VSVLGGEVDSLMETNTLENILKSTLYVILYHEFNATENICILCTFLLLKSGRKTLIIKNLKCFLYYSEIIILH
jgi:hypothetical protein